MPERFGDLHGKLFDYVLNSPAYREQFNKPRWFVSVSTTKTYTQTANCHPILGTEYVQDAYSLTDEYFSKMGLSVRYFMPPKSVAPFLFYFKGDLLNDYTNLELISALALMKRSKIYRPEIYNANSVAGQKLSAQFKSSRLFTGQISMTVKNAASWRFNKVNTQKPFIKPYQTLLQNWLNSQKLNPTKLNKSAKQFANTKQLKKNNDDTFSNINGR